MTDPSVAVAGGGLAGLTAAARLAESGADVTLFERRAAPGGRVRTRRADGFTLDRGFQVLFTGYPAVGRELDLDALDLRAFKPGGVVARGDRRSVLADPFGDPAAAVESALNPEVTVGDKLRTLALRRSLGRTDPGTLFEGPDASIRSYLRERGFSERYVERFVAPLYGGITLDRSLSTSKRVFEYTFKAMAEGRVAVPADGMGAIPAQLADRARAAGATLHLDEPVTAVDADGDGARVEAATRSLDADAVVVATDPREAADLAGVEGVPTEARSCVTQYYSLPGEGLGVGGRIVLNADDARPNTVAPLSAVAPEYAPDGVELLSATFLGDDVDRPAEALAERSRDALSRWFPERRFDGLDVVDTTRVRFAQFAQPPGVHDGLPGVRAAGGRTYLAGDYTRWSSIQGALESGRRAAEAVRSDLG
jgi:phytoene dehydrogenase-like protein